MTVEAIHPDQVAPRENTTTSLLTPDIIFAPSSERPFPKMKLVNTRVFLTEMEKKYGREMKLTQLPDSEWDDLLSGDFEYLYLMGIYKPTKEAEAIARRYKHQYRYSLPDMTDDDVVASPFAIDEYEPAPTIAASWKDWDENVRDKLHKRNVKIALDYVLYDTAVGSPLAVKQPDLFIRASDELVTTLQDKDVQFERVRTQDGQWINIAHAGEAGNTPWIDKLQLDLSNPEALDYKARQAAEIARHCDGLRVDMAKLGFPDAIIDKWHWLLTDQQREALYRNPPWPYIIARIHAANPSAEIIGELYGDAHIDEGKRVGIGAAYDEKTLLLFRQIVSGQLHGADLVPHLRYVGEFLNGHERVAYSENHDTPRAYRDLGREPSVALAAIDAFTPHTIWMVQEGQETGSRVQLPMQLDREPDEPADIGLQKIYEHLYRIRNSTVFQQGHHRVMTAAPLHPDNHSNLDVVVQESQLPNRMGMIACTNTGNWHSECKVEIPPGAKEVRVFDVMTGEFIGGNLADRLDGENRLPIALDPYRVQVAYYAL